MKLHSETTPALSLEQGLYEDSFGYGLQISMPHLWIDLTRLGAVKHDRGPVLTDLFRMLTTFFLCPMAHRCAVSLKLRSDNVCNGC